MIKKVRIRNFKRIEDQTFELTDFDLLVGSNNSGKSSFLQALSIWQFCVEQFKRVKRAGKTGIQIVLPNFTALPLPEFNLIWFEKTERKYPKVNGSKKQEFILVEIEVFWHDAQLIETSLCIQLRYQSPQSVYAIPSKGWADFNELSTSSNFPVVVYVPPFSGLEPKERWFDEGNIREQVGKAQPGSVLRNLLFRVVDKDVLLSNNQQWLEIQLKVKEWFGVTLNPPQYEKGQSLNIELTFDSNDKTYDVIAGGSGFHQVLTLFAFLFGYSGITTILFDEPDAHLHSNLQRQILSYFRQQKQVQFIIATHSEEFIKSVSANSILSLLSGTPKRVQTSEAVVKAMSEVKNQDIIQTKESPFVLYLEGEDDDRILRSWAEVAKFQQVYSRFHIVFMRGPSKEEMKSQMDTHFQALKEINPGISRVALFDRDESNSFHPEPGNFVLKKWKRRNIENYLLNPIAWKQAVLDSLNEKEFDLLNNDYRVIIDNFFGNQNLTLSGNQTWTNLSANIFEEVDGKRILFENPNSLFHTIKAARGLAINREKVSINFTKEILHQDVFAFFEHLKSVVSPTS